MHVSARKTLGQSYVPANVSVTCLFLTACNTECSSASLLDVLLSRCSCRTTPWKHHSQPLHCGIIPGALRFFPLLTAHCNGLLRPHHKRYHTGTPLFTRILRCCACSSARPLTCISFMLTIRRDKGPHWHLRAKFPGVPPAVLIREAPPTLLPSPAVSKGRG